MTLLLPAFTGPPEVNKVYNCDALTLLKALKDNSIDMCLCSPPYDSLRSYHGYSFEFEPIARETYRVLKPGGVCVWVVGDSTVNGSETLTSMRQALYFVDVCGFRMHDTMIWDKQSGNPHQPYIRYCQTFEYMFVLSKGLPITSIIPTFAITGQTKKRSRRKADGTLKRDISRIGGGALSNVWQISSGYMKATKDKDAYEHPAIFPEEIAYRHIETWTHPGEIVLDYFGGSGTTAKMARQYGRDYITCDISLEYCELMRKRLSQPYTPQMFQYEPIGQDTQLEASLS